MRRWCLLVLCACYEPPAADYCHTACVDSCPDGYTCTGSVCHADDGHCDAQPITDAVAIGVGSRHSCALEADHTIACWGHSDLGQVGTGSGVFPAATKVPGTYQQLAVGSEHTCALTLDGIPTCWGNNDDGEVVGASSGPVFAPTAVEFASGDGHPATFTAICAGGSHTCAIGDDASMWCWGNAGTLGSGFDSSPMRVAGSDTWTTLSCGVDHVCGLTGTGVSCFGRNGAGQIALGMPDPIEPPIHIDVMGTAFAVTAGDDMTCALVDGDPAAGGKLVCWGNSGGSDRLNDTGVILPKQLGTLTSWTAAKGGANSVCGIHDGMVSCWGLENFGVLGDGQWQHTQGPADDTPSIGAATVVDVAIGAPPPDGFDEHACMLSAGTVSCWGDSAHGALGSGPPRTSNVPVEVARPSGGTWTQLATGFTHVCATTDDHALWCWGADDHAQVSAQVPRGGTNPCIAGQPCDFATPTRGPAMVGPVDDLVAGFQYTCTREGGTVHCWGRSSQGVLGDAGQIKTDTGFAVVAPPNGAWTRLSGGDVASCGVTTTDTTSYCWGHVPGAGDVNRPFAETTSDALGMTSVSFGDDFACGVHPADGTALAQHRVCWRNGSDNDGALGTGTPDNQTTPLAYPNVNVAVPLTTALSAETAHACAIDEQAKVWCWGNGFPSEVIGVSMVPQPTPAPVNDDTSQQLANCTRIATTNDHSCAVCNSDVRCWGDDGGGRAKLGRGESTTDQQDAAARRIAGGIQWSEVGTFGGGGCAITLDHTKLFCWGEGPHGELGNGGHDRNLPTPVGTTN